MALYKLSLEKYLDKLAEKIPAPGGGSASALVAACGVSLFKMCVVYSQKNFDPSRFKSLTRKLERMRKNLIQLVEEDKKAYLKLSRAYKKNAGSKEVNSARKKAGDIPAKICEYCLEVIKIMLENKKNIKRIFNSDFVASLKFLIAGLESARIFVAINCEGIKSLEDRLDRIDGEYKKIRKELKKWVQK
jgi:formiminotetrahydrofolate cyclodeaminase